MSVDKYKFVSPGVFVKELDKSEVPGTAAGIGPVIIGRTERGPAFRPTMVQSMDEFNQIFGGPLPGGSGGDVWRNGNYTSPTYAGYAVKAYLQNNGPVTIVRTLGIQDDDATGTTQLLGAPGWTIPAIGTNVTDGGAYGLWLLNSASLGSTQQTGTLAAVWYLDGARIALSGVVAYDDSPTPASTASNAVMIQSSGDKEFKVAIETSAGTKTYAFNFDKDSDKYIRKVFNTNPIKTNAALNSTTTLENYWLGQTFESSIARDIETATQTGVMLGLKDSAGTNQGGDFLGLSATPSETGWFISQDLEKFANAGAGFEADQQPELFKFVGQAIEGADLQRRIKISISNIKAAVKNDEDRFGSFSVEIRDIKDTDARKNVLERFDGLNLNPNSPKYIAAVIGDRYIEWNTSERRYKERGDYQNNSKYVRLSMSENITNGLISDEALPFGAKGPLKFRDALLEAAADEDFRIQSGSFVSSLSICHNFTGSNGTDSHVGRGNDIGDASPAAALLRFPRIALRSSSNLPEGFSSTDKPYFGVNLLVSGSARVNDGSIADLVHALPADYNLVQTALTEPMWTFTLDDLRDDILDGNNANVHTTYESGSHEAGKSVNVVAGRYQEVLDRGFDQFTTVLAGGFDGLDITESDPFRNTILDGTDSGYGANAATNYAKASIKRALEVISDAEEMDFNLAVMPGITNEGLTQDLADICEDRGDALAIIDPKGDYQPIHEGLPSTFPQLGSVSTAVSNMKSRDLNSSYACAYYPWVQTKDGNSGKLLWIPPSIVALGTMGSSATNSELWFAPAGFNRGGLSEGSAGLAVVSAREKLTSTQRDDLYENRINPIASFPSEGLVIFGQKTTQIKSSALDRINVRRLMIFLKKEISRIANGILFDQNVQSTWDRFTSQANPLLSTVKTRFGLEDYKLVLDETTTTPDLRDRNIMYAKVFLKPAKSIEFIALDFTIMNSGAAFED